MANPPFNVDLVDAERIKGDPRLPFGLPGMNKGQEGRQRQLPVDLLLLELPERQRPRRLRHVLPGIQRRPRRNVCRKVTRKIYDFSPEQRQNLAAIVWLHRGQRQRFLGLVKDCLGRVCGESAKIPAGLGTFETTLAELRGRFDALTEAAAKHADLDAEKRQALADAVIELNEAVTPYETDRKKLLQAIDAFVSRHSVESGNPDNEALHTARKAFDPIAEAIRGLVKQVDLLYKLAARAAQLATDIAVIPAGKPESSRQGRQGPDTSVFLDSGQSMPGMTAYAFDHRATGRLVKQLDEERKSAVEQLKHALNFHRQVTWLRDRFPKAELEAVPGLVKLVDRKDIEVADWSLTPGRYVGVAPPEEDEDLDFEQKLREIQQRAGRTQYGGGGAGGADSGELRGAGGMTWPTTRMGGSTLPGCSPAKFAASIPCCRISATSSRGSWPRCWRATRCGWTTTKDTRRSSRTITARRIG
jgi:hypothetical protein